jgi:hypothetical protein
MADRFARTIVGFLKVSCAARSRRLNPTMAAGVHTAWTNEALINEQWMLVVGFATGDSHEQAQHQFAPIQHQLQMLLGIER